MRLHEDAETFSELVQATAETVGLPEVYIEKDYWVSKGSKYRKTLYRYPRSVDGAEFGQASPELMIEVNAFTRPEPYELRHSFNCYFINVIAF